MLGKLSEINDKNEYEKIVKDYNNNYGYNLGFNGYITTTNKDNQDKTVKDLFIMKKR